MFENAHLCTSGMNDIGTAKTVPTYGMVGTVPSVCRYVLLNIGDIIFLITEEKI